MVFMKPRFYVDLDQFEDYFLLTGSEFHHFSRVMRIRSGEEVELINGRGILAHAHVEEVGKEAARLLILESIEESPPSPALFLGIALFRLNRLEWLIEKGTELGATGFYLFPAERSEQQKLSYHQLLRLRHLAVAAMKQCRRLYLPEITFCSSLSDLLNVDGQILFGDLGPKALPIKSITLSEQILFVTGPEGGFSQNEFSLLKKQGAQAIKLHENTLRAETAPLAALYGLYSRHFNV